LPAGDYLVSATGWASASNLADYLSVYCILKVGGTTLADAFAEDEYETSQSVAMQGLATPNATTTAALVCSANSDYNRIQSVRLTALQVQF
jgi:hypothetical protein